MLPDWAIAVIVIGLGSFAFILVFGITVVSISYISNNQYLLFMILVMRELFRSLKLGAVLPFSDSRSHDIIMSCLVKITLLLITVR